MKVFLAVRSLSGSVKVLDLYVLNVCVVLWSLSRAARLCIPWFSARTLDGRWGVTGTSDLLGRGKNEFMLIVLGMNEMELCERVADAFVIHCCAAKIITSATSVALSFLPFFFFFWSFFSEWLGQENAGDRGAWRWPVGTSYRRCPRRVRGTWGRLIALRRRTPRGGSMAAILFETSCGLIPLQVCIVEAWIWGCCNKLRVSFHNFRNAWLQRFYFKVHVRSIQRH
jgi:hypothetical protein